MKFIFYLINSLLQRQINFHWIMSSFKNKYLYLLINFHSSYKPNAESHVFTDTDRIGQVISSSFLTKRVTPIS